MKIRIEDSAGAFDVVLIDPKGKEERFHIDQEDTHEKLVKVFKKLGFKASYKEVY